MARKLLQTELWFVSSWAFLHDLLLILSQKVDVCLAKQSRDRGEPKEIIAEDLARSLNQKD